MKTTMPVSTPRQLLESEIERSADLKGLLATDRTDTAFMLVIVILLVLGFLARFCRRLEQVDRPPIRAHMLHVSLRLIMNTVLSSIRSCSPVSRK